MNEGVPDRKSALYVCNAKNIKIKRGEIYEIFRKNQPEKL